MLSVKTRLKIQSIKKKLIKTWYTLMKPITCMIIKYEKLHSYIYNKKMKKVEQWSNECVIKLYTKEFIKNITRRAIKYNENEWYLYVADSVNDDYYEDYIISGAIRNSKNDNISNWIYKKDNSLKNRIDLVGTLTDLLKMELDKCDNIRTEYVVENKLKDAWDINSYEKTLVIKLNINK